MTNKHRDPFDRDAFRAKLVAEAAARDAQREAAGHLVKHRQFRIERGYIGWEYYHEDYDGPEDNRCGAGLASVADCKAEIDEYYDDLAERDRAAAAAPFKAVADIFDKAAKS